MSQQNNDKNNNKPSYPKPPAPPAQPLTGMSQETYRRFMEQQGLQPSAWVPDEAIREKRAADDAVARLQAPKTDEEREQRARLILAAKEGPERYAWEVIRHGQGQDDEPKSG